MFLVFTDFLNKKYRGEKLSPCPDTPAYGQRVARGQGQAFGVRVQQHRRPPCPSPVKLSVDPVTDALDPAAPLESLGDQQ